MPLLKTVFAIVLAGYGLWGAFNPKIFVFIDGANLLFHESGHALFGFLGTYGSIWGGTLMQLLIPGALLMDFFKLQNSYAASVMMFWLGENFFHISTYIKDATTKVLPLVGGCE